jgi:hypothetical protein
VLFDLNSSIGQAIPLGAADVIIVGAGAVGICTAVELARAGRRVVVLEAGPKSVSKESQAFFESASCVARPLQGLHQGRFRALGGSTNLWGGQLVRMDPIVFQHRPWIADVGWPINEDDLAEGYNKAFDLLGMRRHIPEDNEVWTRLRIKPPPHCEEVDVFFTRWTPEPNFARLFRREIARKENLIIVLQAQVVALQFSAGVIEGVKVRTIEGRELTFRSLVVILANGTIEIARLLQLPLDNGSRAPWNNNNWLGKGFMDHIDFYAGSIFVKDKARFHELFDNVYLSGIKYQPKLKLSAKTQMEIQATSMSCHFIFNSSLSEHAYFAKRFLSSLCGGGVDRTTFLNWREVVNFVRVGLPIIRRYLLDRRMYNFNGDIQLRVATEQKPLASSEIRLTGKKDSLGIPEVELEWHVDGAELSSIAAFAEIVCAYIQKFGLATVQLDPALGARDPAFLNTGNDANHHMGGARMASSSSLGVVDRNLRVYGTRNLYVAGAATFPTAGVVNPTFTAIALGLRLSNMICKQQ